MKQAAARAYIGRSGSEAGIALRRAALRILVRVERTGSYADVLLGHAPGTLAPADRRLLNRLVLGTIAWRGRLDYEIAALAARPVEQIDLDLLAILRLGLFQMRFLDRIPAHAVVNTAVALARESAGARRAAGMVNAILRRAALAVWPLPDRDADQAGYLAVAYSHPRWLVKALVEWFGLERAERIMAANNEAAPNAARLNLARGSRETLLIRLREEGFEIEATQILPETIILKRAAAIESAAHAAGLFHFQSEASQLVARMLAPAPGALVADCAAAPGGKSTHLAELIGPAGLVVAFDRSRARLDRARQLAYRLGHRNIVFICADLAHDPPALARGFDAVLVDAPCTGLGTLREHPEIRWRLNSEDFGRMAAIQRLMLDRAQTLVRRGGALVYSVCSLAPAEGRAVVDNFLATHPEFRIDPCPPGATGSLIAHGTDGFLQTAPDRNGLDGFFVVRLQRATL